MPVFKLNMSVFITQDFYITFCHRSAATNFHISALVYRSLTAPRPSKMVTSGSQSSLKSYNPYPQRNFIFCHPLPAAAGVRVRLFSTYHPDGF